MVITNKFSFYGKSDSLTETMLQAVFPHSYEIEAHRLQNVENPDIDIKSALFILQKMYEYNAAGVADSIFTPTAKLDKFYKKYAIEGKKEYLAKCYKLMARIERWR